jgi:CubicO group peptidase (beta-lactamase class C family)
MTAATTPELVGTEYGATPLRSLLHMSSGVVFRETYEPGDDIFKLQAALLWKGATGAISALKQFNTRDAPPGRRFSYASAETEVLGLVVSRAVHMTLADYFSTRIWQRLGAESDAAWAFDPTGQEVAYCCFGEVVDQLRKSLATQYLKDPGMSLGQIAWLLGYEGSTSFNHAFKRWTGRSPSADRTGE